MFRDIIRSMNKVFFQPSQKNQKLKTKKIVLNTKRIKINL